MEIDIILGQSIIVPYILFVVAYICGLSSSSVIITAQPLSLLTLTLILLSYPETSMSSVPNNSRFLSMSPIVTSSSSCATKVGMNFSQPLSELIKRLPTQRQLVPESD